MASQHKTIEFYSTTSHKSMEMYCSMVPSLTHRLKADAKQIVWLRIYLPLGGLRIASRKSLSNFDPSQIDSIAKEHKSVK